MPFGVEGEKKGAFDAGVGAFDAGASGSWCRCRGILAQVRKKGGDLRQSSA